MHLSKPITAVLLVATSLGYACKSSDVAPGDFVTVGRQQSARTSSGVTVDVDTISDSRCPVDVTCIWAGVAIVSARLTKGSTVSVRLQTRYTSDERPDSTGVVLAGETYKVVLRDVTPYPKPGPGPASKAVLQVSKL